MAAQPGSRRTVVAGLAAGLSGLAAAELATAVACALAGGSSFATAVGSFTVTNGAIGLALSACGALLAWHRPRNPVGWLFLAGGIAYATSAAAAQVVGFGATAGWNAGVLRTGASLFTLAWPLAIGLCVPMALLLFPDGRPPGPRWRWLIWAITVEALLFELMFASPGSQTFGSRSVTPYLALPSHDRLGAVWAATNIAWAAILALVLASLVARYRRGGDVERRQLLWLVLAVVVVLAYAGLAWGIFGAGPVLGLLVIPLIPAAVTIAILRDQLLDIRLVVSRTLVYGLLTAAAAGAYVGLVALLDVLVRSRVSLGSAIAASIVVAIGFNPARVRLQRLIDRALYGDRRDPVRAVSLVGERLVGTGAAGLAGVLEALCESLRLPFAVVRYGPAEAAAHGTAPELLHSIGLRYDGIRIGELIVGVRTGQRRLGSPDLAVLELLAGPLALALHATALSAALQESRVGIVAAREEERRRLRRDLHDGLGPALTGIAFKADAARNTLLADPVRASELIGQLRADTTAAIGDIRRLVYGLRPPALDDLGLIGSLRQQSARLAQRPDGTSLAVQLDAPEDMPPLPAAVEVAAYRIVTEAMTNAARHSGATSIKIRLALPDGDDLRIEVSDDGAGPPSSWQAGFGLISMRERAAELGGSCEAGPAPDGGGRVTASLPLGQSTAELTTL
ncbi:MAG TPA: sensor histidine kinase [Streptosporangiaceae bacterium]|nr:sensor histidine kinase [Streptosporangiaceae bacterium]